MNSEWSDAEAQHFSGSIALRVYTSRLLGRDKSLVLHGGGNTSVKIVEKNVLGEAEEVLYVKGSGWDLERIEAEGFSPVRLAHLKRLAGLPALPDSQMVDELVTHQTRASAPVPSVEAILHAILPYSYVDHTHADAILTVTNTVDGEARVREIYGDEVVVIPYVMPGFDLARSVAERFPAQATSRTIGMVLLNHGIFSFGQSARESYERMIALVDRAERYLRGREAWVAAWPQATPDRDVALELAQLRRQISRVAGFPVVMSRRADPKSLAFARRDDVAAISQQGPATPDHVIRTKRVPQLGRDVERYAEEYAKYFVQHEARARQRKIGRAHV